VFNLRPVNIEAMGYDGELLYSLVSALDSVSSLRVMPRREMEDVLQQSGLAQGDNPDLALEAGRALGVDYVLFGQVGKEGGAIRSRLHLLSVAQGETIRSWNFDFSGREAIIGAGPQLAREVADAAREPRAAAAAPPQQPRQERARLSIEGFTARSEGNDVLLTWSFDPADPVAAFHVYRAHQESGPYQFLARTDTNRYLDEQARKGSTYHYVLAAVLHDGREVKHPAAATVKAVGEKIPHAPLILEATGHVGRVDIKFVPSLLNGQEGFRIDHYVLFMRPPPGDGADAPAWTRRGRVAAAMRSQGELALHAVDTGLEDGAAYQYCLASVDSRDRESPCSDTASLSTLPTPTLELAADNLLRRMDLAWTPLPGVEGYYLYRRPTGGVWEKTARLRHADTRAYTDEDGLEDGVYYQYHLTAFDAQAETGASNVVEGKTKDRFAPPAGLGAQSGLVKSVRLHWTPLQDPDIGGYAVYRGLSPDALAQIDRVRGADAGAYLDKGSPFDPLEDGTTYHYAVTTYNLFRAEGPASPPVSATTKPRPRAPQQVRAVALLDHIQLSWAPGREHDLVRYRLERSRNGGIWFTLGEVPAAETRYDDRDIRPESSYQYRITVEDRDGLESDPALSDAVASPLSPE
jgi:fibronectin type 3 domain-containing protein/TolB-like protein